jgi:hypothetical protein
MKEDLYDIIIITEEDTIVQDIIQVENAYLFHKLLIVLDLEVVQAAVLVLVHVLVQAEDVLDVQ